MTFCVVIITFYQRMLLGMSANQKRHYAIDDFFNEVNTRIDQPIEHDIHLDRCGLVEYHVPWFIHLINCIMLHLFLKTNET